MNVTRMDELGFCGRTIDVKCRGSLQVLMAKKQQEEKLMSMRFWGLIDTEVSAEEGRGSDYVICFGVMNVFKGVPVKKFYVTGGAEGYKTLTQLPPLKPEVNDLLASHDMKGFSGQHADAIEGVMNDGDDSESVTELHLLSRRVRLIDNDVTVVPRGAFVVDASHQVLENAVFRGLNHMSANKLSSYYHFRAPAKQARKTVLENKGLVKSTDFLDPISEDQPNGVWSLQMSGNRSKATLRSLLWPGYFFYHNVNTNDYGGAYFGDGKKNDAILFML